MNWRRGMGSGATLASALLTLAACAQLNSNEKPVGDREKSAGDHAKAAVEQSTLRAQLSVGYTLLYQEADGIPKLRWIFLFKKTPGEMGQLTDELIDYYEQLAETMRRLSKEYPGMRLDVVAMSDIEAKERKSIGEDLAKDFAPVIGKTGLEFQREALLMFYDALNEQRHLVRVMAAEETDPGLHKFLETTESQLQDRYDKVAALLNERYFTR